jgi:hypothetical protein
MATDLKLEQWDESDDPVPMIEHLGRRDCTLDFTPLADVLLIRVWRRVRDETLRQVMYEWFGTGQTKLTQDEANAAAADRIKVLSKKLGRLKPGSTEHSEITSEIKLGRLKWTSILGPRLKIGSYDFSGRLRKPSRFRFPRKNHVKEATIIHSIF